MPHMMAFDDVLEAVEKLSADEQEALLSIVRRRLARQGRGRVAKDIAAARKEFAAGECRPARVDDLMREIET